MAEHLTRNEKVVSSILTSSSNFWPLISQEFSGFFFVGTSSLLPRGAYKKQKPISFPNRLHSLFVRLVSAIASSKVHNTTHTKKTIIISH